MDVMYYRNGAYSIEKHKFTVFIRKFELKDGQSIYVKKIEKKVQVCLISNQKWIYLVQN